jgi:hypothetical protein
MGFVIKNFYTIEHNGIQTQGDPFSSGAALGCDCDRSGYYFVF